MAFMIESSISGGARAVQQCTKQWASFVPHTLMDPRSGTFGIGAGQTKNYKAPLWIYIGCGG